MSSSSSSSNNQEDSKPQTQEQELNTTNRNPVTRDELQKKLKDIANDKEKSARFQEQLAIKFRTEMQNYKYTPTDEFKDHPSLQPTDVELSKQQSPTTQANSKLGETKLTNDQVVNAVTPDDNNTNTTTIADETTTQTAGNTVDKVQQEQQAQDAASTQDNPSQSVKG